MKVLFDIGHPAHVHYFRETAKKLIINNHEVLFTLRDKDIAEGLLIKYNLPYVKIGNSKKGIINKILWVYKFTYRILKVMRKFKPELCVSFYSPYLAYASTLMRIPSIGFADTEHAIYNIKTTYPFTNVSITPKCFTSILGRKHLTFDGFMELSYLHDNYFKPNSEILSKLNVQKDKYAILRFVSWDAHHDIGQSGLNKEIKRAIVARLKTEFQVFISSEGILPEEFEPYRIKIPVDKIHDVLAFAHLFIGEGATMASECAMLGTPAIYVNSLDAGTLQEQERRGLIAGFRNADGVMEKLEEWLSNENLKENMNERRSKMLKEMIDPTKMLVWFIENYPESFKIMKENPDYQYNFK